MLKQAALFWVAPRSSMRAVLERRPSEAALAAIILLGVVILLAGRFWVISLTPGVDLGTTDEDARLQHMVAETTVAFLLVLVFYGFAAIGTMISRLFRGEGHWWTGRVAFFWATCMSAPFLVASEVGPKLVQLSPPGTALVGQLGSVIFAWAISQCFAEAFRFTQTWRVFAVLAAIILTPLGAIWVLSG